MNYLIIGLSLLTLIITLFALLFTITPILYNWRYKEKGIRNDRVWEEEDNK